MVIGFHPKQMWRIRYFILHSTPMQRSNVETEMKFGRARQEAVHLRYGLNHLSVLVRFSYNMCSPEKGSTFYLTFSIISEENHCYISIRISRIPEDNTPPVPWLGLDSTSRRGLRQLVVGSHWSRSLNMAFSHSVVRPRREGTSSRSLFLFRLRSGPIWLEKACERLK